MKASKKKREVTYTAGIIYGPQTFKPLDEIEYPKWNDLYMRFYVRPKFIIYIEFYKTMDIKGFLIVWQDFDGQQTKVIEKLPFQSMYEKVMQWCDANEDNKFHHIISILVKN